MKRFLINLLRKFKYVRLLEMHLKSVVSTNSKLRRSRNREFGINFNLKQDNKKLRNDIKVVSGVLDKVNERLTGQYIAYNALKKDNGTLLKRIYEQSEVIASLYKRLEVAENSDNWIPVSEKLPSKSDFYLVTLSENRGIEYCYYGKGGTSGWLLIADGSSEDNTAWEEKIDTVIAWQPLPEPYRPKEGK